MLTRLSLRRRIVATAVTLLAAAIPALVVVPIVLHEARRQVDGEARVTASVISHQIDNILLRTQDTIQTLEPALSRPCGNVLEPLRQAAAQRPYIRSVMLVRDDLVYCSSNFGALATPLITTGPQDHVPRGLTVTPVPGTLLLPDRPAVLMSLGLRGGQGLVASVDAQYLFDLKAAASRNGMYNIDIVLGRERQPLLESSERRRPIMPTTADTQISASTAFPVEVHVTPQGGQREMVKAYPWPAFLAFVVLAGLLCGYGAYRAYGWRVSIPGEIRKGIRARQFHLVYQPVLNLATGRFTGVEALLRWRHPHLGQVRPDLFIAAAEEHGIIDDLTRHMFELAGSDLRVLGLPPGGHLGVNVCGHHMAQNRFADDVERLFERVRETGDLELVLEVTERHALPDTPVLRGHMARLRERGILWALDDFGTGHSSLPYLERLQADYLKIDRAFVSAAGTDAISGVVLDTIIALARKVGMEMVAEGIETEAQRAYLRDKGVQYAQGFLYARPMPARELAAWLAARAELTADT